MKLMLHRMRKCKKCTKVMVLLHRFNISFQSLYDNPEQDRPYPYLTIELEHEEILHWISTEKLQ